VYRFFMVSLARIATIALACSFAALACAPGAGEGEGEGESESEGESISCELVVEVDLATQVSSFCALGGSCNDPGAAQIDPVPGTSADSVAVCESDLLTLHQVWQVNSEPGCQQVASAHAAFMGCAEQSGCDAFVASSATCKTELDSYQDLRAQQAGACDE
jgi:hypothetical protein